MSSDRTAVSRLILVRHAESEGNRDRTFTQSAEVPITAHGRAQAQRAAARIAGGYRPARLVASPYRRARQTADIIAAALGLAVDLEPALREQSFGVFAGQPYDAVLGDAAYHAGPRWRWRPQGGESLADVRARAVPAFERIARDSAGRDVVLVSHGGVMLALCAHVTGSWDAVAVTPNAGILVVEYAGGAYRAPLPLPDE